MIFYIEKIIKLIWKKIQKILAITLMAITNYILMVVTTIKGKLVCIIKINFFVYFVCDIDQNPPNH